MEFWHLNSTNGMLGGFTIKRAVYKTNLIFANAFFMGILCNWLVCLAVWRAFGAKDIAGKLLVTIQDIRREHVKIRCRHR